MTEWFLWDGEGQYGPMDRRELERLIHDHPRPQALQVWREGFGGWKNVQDAFGVDVMRSPLDPSSFEPHRSRRSSNTAKYQNFVARNWRGEYPLWLSYWIIGFFANIFAVFIVVAMETLPAASSYHPARVLALLITVWIMITLFSVWQWVGIWRSAQERIDQRAALGRRAPWAGLAKLMVCLSILQMVGLLIRTGIPQVAEATSMAFMDDPTIPAYSIRLLNNGSEVEVIGGIKFGLSRDFETVLNASKQVRVVHLNSVGGRLGEGKQLNNLIQSRGLDTYVDSQCLSACTLAFVGGRQRILKRGARLGFHRAAFAGEDQVDGNLERSIFVAAGVDAPFIDRVLATKNADMWEPSPADLMSAKVVTRISTGDEFAIGASTRRLTRSDWDDALQKESPAYKAMKDNQRVTYDAMLDTLLDGASKGTPQAEVIESVREKMLVLVKTLLPGVEDAVLVDFGKLIVDQYQAIQSQDKIACYRYAVGQHDQSVARLIPPQLIKRELDLDARIIRSTRKQETGADTGPLWEKIGIGLRKKGYTASDLQLLARDPTSSSDRERYCDVTIGMYQEVTALPAKEAAVVLRELFN